MLSFYRRALIGLALAIAGSLLLAYFGIKSTFLHSPLLSDNHSEWQWQPRLATDNDVGGASQIQLHDSKVNLSFDFTLSDQHQYPYASVGLIFQNPNGQPHLVDLSRYELIRFQAKCTPKNTLSLTASTVVESVTQLDDFLTYRPTTAFFSCHDQWTTIELDLTRLETPQWWYDLFKLDLANQKYTLDQVPQLAFGSTFQSPSHTSSSVQLHNIELIGRDWLFAYLACALITLVWLAYGVWFFRHYTRALTSDLKDKMHKDLPLVAYQQLSLEPYRDKEKSSILRFMATEYANEDLSLETLVKSLGISRTKINEVLKSELGYTFVTYLNKLRLTEAARLLSEDHNINVSEVAFSVGYKSPSYFNKLFKDEYGCTPKTFKNLCQKPDSST